MLTCLVAALLCHGDSTLAVGQWCRDQHDLLTQLFGARRFLCPSDSLYRKRLPRLDAEQIECALADWIRATLQAAPDDPLALDGKTVRGARAAGHHAPHVLSFRTHQSHEMVLQVEVAEKTKEIPLAQALLPCLPVCGRVCTADAFHTRIDFHRFVHAFGGFRVLTLKQKQPLLFEALATYFADRDAVCARASTRDDHRGRTEIRSIKVSTAMNTYLSVWPHLAQVAELTRTVTVRRTGKTSQEIAYLITDLTPVQATPERL